MPKLYEITDAYSPEETIDSLPVEQTLPTDRPRVIINTAEFDKPKEPTLWDNVGMAGVENKDTALSNLKSKASSIADAIKYASELDQKFTSSVLNFPKKAYENSDDLVKGLKNLFGLGEEERRYQLWPEKVVREALTSAGDIAKPNPYPEGSEQYYEYEGKRQEGMVPAAMAISALAGSGGLGGTGAKAGEVALGATPFLRPALKHKEKLYKGKPGQEHQDIIPKELYEDFRQKAMSGEDLAEYNFGFINDKGHFLDREKALKYGIDTGIIDPHSGKFGALTTTLMADSSKPGTAIEAMAKTKFDFKPGESSGSRSVKLGPTEITYGVNPKNNDVELSLIRTDKNKRGEGSARAATEQFLAEADANGKRVLLNADPMDKSTSKAKLEDFYKSLGFVRNSGRNKDFTTRAEYIRDPVLKADSSKPGVAIESMKAAQPFYSAVEHTVKNINQSKMNGEAWLGTLANKPGVKPEELDWIGLRSFLEENKGKPVTKAQIEEHLAANKVELKEYKKGGNVEKEMDAADAAKETLEAAYANHPPVMYKGEALNNPQGFSHVLAIGGLKPEELPAALRPLAENFKKANDAYKQAWETQSGETKYHSYQLPGGENYREMLLTLPNQSDEQFIKAYEASTGVNVKQLFGRDPTSTEIANLRRNSAASEVSGEYKSSHWDEPNILAHVRMNDRNIDGKKSLGINEAQSDWHQQGRKTGYAPAEAEKIAASNQIKEIRQQQQDLLKSRITKTPDGKYSVKMDNGETFKFNDQQSATQVAMMPTGEVRPKWIELDEKAAELGKIASNVERKVPDAPFKKTWHELVIKRMIREAAEKGYDNLHFPGSPETVAKVEGWTNFKKKMIKGEERYFTGDQDVTPIINRYLVDFPRFLNKLGKEHGVKVEQHKFSIREKGAAPSDYSEGVLNNIDIPQSLKDTALNKGFPLFSNGYMLIPVQGNPFSDNK